MKKVALFLVAPTLVVLAFWHRSISPPFSATYLALMGSTVIAASIAACIGFVASRGTFAERLPAAIKWMGIALTMASVALGFITSEWSSACELTVLGLFTLILWKFGMSDRLAPPPAT